MDDIILSLKEITKEFPGVKALDSVSFDVKRGQVHALIGENGAGKSTLNKIISGIYKADKGSIIFDGKERKFSKPLDAKMAGISIVHQEINLVETLSVAENIFIGEYFHKGIFVDFSRLYDESKKLLDRLGLDLNVNQEVGSLTVAQQQAVEICKSLKNNAKLLIMDEPSASLTEKELVLLFEIIEKLRQNDITIIYVSHRLDEIFKICDSYTILRDGQHIQSGEVKAINKNDLIRMMVGRQLDNVYPKDDLPIGETVLKADHLTRGNVIRDVSLFLRKGEILGISGLVGSGRTELVRAILKIDPYDSGTVTLKGKISAYSTFYGAIDCKMGLIPEDRKQQGLILGMNICENIAIVRNRKHKNIFINRKKEKETSQKYIELFDVQPAIQEMEILHFSGGNQQKIVIAKWLDTEADIIIIDEPTRGIDVGVKSEIYKIMNKLASEGRSIIMISSEMPELIGMCDRIYIMHEGKMKGVLNREEFSQEAIMRIAIDN